MNLAIRGIEADLGSSHGDSFLNDLHKDRPFDYVIANPPFNMKEWGGAQLKKDPRWLYGVPPVGNANYAWIQHFIRHLSPGGTAGFVLANGSLSSQQSGEGEIRKAIIEADLVDCVVALPDKLFYSTGIPACLWFLTRNKSNGKLRDRRGHTLFIDARSLGMMRDRVHRELTEEEVARIATCYHTWRGDSDACHSGLDAESTSEATCHSGLDPESIGYKNLPGFCKSVPTRGDSAQSYVHTPGRYVGHGPKPMRTPNHPKPKCAASPTEL